MSRVAHLTAFASFLLLAGPGRAQQPLALDSGQIVRVRTAAHTERGRLLSPLSVDDSLLRYCLYPAQPCSASTGPRRDIPLTSIVSLDRRAGSRWREGALVGFVIGAGFGLLVHSFAEGVCDSSDCVPSYQASVILPGLAFAALGAAFGDSRSVWQAVPLERAADGRLPNQCLKLAAGLALLARAAFGRYIKAW